MKAHGENCESWGSQVEVYLGSYKSESEAQKCRQENFFFKLNSALTNVAQLVGHQSANKRSPVQFPVRPHAWVVGPVPTPGARERQPIDVSLSHGCFSPSLFLSLPLSLKINE